MSSPPERPPGSRQGLDRWITEWARETSENAGRLRRRIGVLVLAGMVDSIRDEAGEPSFLFKGGSAMEIRFESSARVSRDVDLVFRGAIEDAYRLLSEAVESGWSGFSGRALDPEPLRIPWTDIAGQRIDVKLTYRRRPYISLPVEVVAAVSAELEYVPTLSLASVGLEPPDEIPCLSLRYQVAEKLHACTDPLDGKRINDRIGDVMDLILTEDLAREKEDDDSTRVACLDVFTRRATHPWPPVLTVQPTWPDLWATLVDENDLPIDDVAEAVQRVNGMIERIDIGP